ncbi:hypothetical protein AMTR_s00091p00146840 [Amborella trichopoda]|uniref:Uncharacterized protein n=1 Tax=Amborella trichopoda TaxID=13333 RepID=W1NYA5_AMBTC|nr:hypothetical protein AMTR_s00091p00146840 [Amborella trichopoda]
MWSRNGRGPVCRTTPTSRLGGLDGNCILRCFSHQNSQDAATPVATCVSPAGTPLPRLGSHPLLQRIKVLRKQNKKIEENRTAYATPAFMSTVEVIPPQILVYMIGPWIRVQWCLRL